MKGFTSQLLHADRQKPIEHGSIHKPIHSSVAYGFAEAQDIADVFQGVKSGYSYGRQVNPTVTALEEKVTIMEQGISTTCFATGMAAITAILFSLLRQGDHVISSQFLFGNTNSLFNTFTQLRVGISFVDATDAAQVAAAITPQTKAVFVETIANPRTQVADLAAIGELCKQKGLLYIVDNTMTSPYLFQPIRVGADLVVHSLTKYIGGHGDALGGSITDTGLFDWERFPNIYDTYKKKDPRNWGMLQIKKKGLRDSGATLSAAAAHQLALGIETLALRMDRSSSNAQQLAEFFMQHPAVSGVYYPGLPEHPEFDRAQSLFRNAGSLMSFELVPGLDCMALLNKLEIPIISSNLGDNRSLVIPVAQTIYFEMGPERRASMGISESIVRLSVGIEEIDDLIADFSQALAAIA
jgi:O-acetylhomoserine (thiol)-lyase